MALSFADWPMHATFKFKHKNHNRIGMDKQATTDVRACFHTNSNSHSNTKYKRIASSWSWRGFLRFFMAWNQHLNCHSFERKFVWISYEFLASYQIIQSKRKLPKNEMDKRTFHKGYKQQNCQQRVTLIYLCLFILFHVRSPFVIFPFPPIAASVLGVCALVISLLCDVWWIFTRIQKLKR